MIIEFSRKKVSFIGILIAELNSVLQIFICCSWPCHLCHLYYDVLMGRDNFLFVRLKSTNDERISS